jgi:hypothetical protein
VKPSYSFVLAVLSCVSTTLLANSPASKNLHLASHTSADASATTDQTVASPDVAVPSFRLPSGHGSYNNHVPERLTACNACTLNQTASISIPSNAIEVSSIHALPGWQGDADSAGTGTASGSTSMVSAPALSGNAREFQTSFTNGGSVRFSAGFGTDNQSTDFLYDGWVYVASPSNDVANIEMDVNQVMANGQTAIFGVQCDGYSSTWDYTANQGTPTSPDDVWVHSTAACNPRNWSSNAWHHIQISYSRDNSGNVTYGSVWFDGTQQQINATVSSAFALGWGAGALVTNFQVDGFGNNGTTQVYLDNLSVYRW